jgi:putative DNA primase/helicase
VRFSLLETALVLAERFTGWTAQESHDALQHSFNAWVCEFGMGNRESKACIEQAQGFLQRFGYSRYLPHPETDPRDMPVKDLAGYRVSRSQDEKQRFYTFPAVFREEISKGYNPIAFAQALAEAGMLDKPLKGLTRKAIRVGGEQPAFVVMKLHEDHE